MSDTKIKGLATLLRNGGNSYQDYRMFLLKPEEAKAYADLLDPPPRFTEAQMAFWRGWYAIGAKFVKRRFGTGCVDFSLTTKDFCTSYPSVLPNDIAIQLEEGKAYDLAELLGKDGAE